MSPREQENFKAYRSIREVVFVSEQGVPLKDEFDDFEVEATHFMGFHNQKPASTGRYRIYKPFIFKLERFAVLKEYRGLSLGKEMVLHIEAHIRKNHKGPGQFFLHAQSNVIGFYEKLGYLVNGDRFMECDIEHAPMIKEFNDELEFKSFSPT